MLGRKGMISKHAHSSTMRMPKLLARFGTLAAATLLLSCVLSGCVVTDPVETTLDDARDAVQEAQDAIGQAADDIQGAADDVNSAISGIANAPQALQDMFESADAMFTKMASIAVYDAQTGEEIAVVDDSESVADVVSKVNLVKLVSSHPDSSTAEYQITFSQNATIKLGQSADEVKRVEAITFTTYRDSNIVEIYSPAVHESINTFDFEATQEFVDALRDLAA